VGAAERTPQVTGPDGSGVIDGGDGATGSGLSTLASVSTALSSSGSSSGSAQPLLPVFDAERAEAAVRELLIAVGENPDRDGLIRTPGRVARAFAEQFSGLHTDPDTVLNTSFDENHNEMILMRDIDMYSTCEHHLVPFFGKAHVGYIPGPDGRVTGLSKLARLVDGYAKRPQVQERLTTQIAEALVRRLQPAGAIVVIEAEHLCMAMRGIRKPGAVTTTSAVRGIFQSQARTRAEAMSLITGR
jgi:GTP cyclohydrolase I